MIEKITYWETPEAIRFINKALQEKDCHYDTFRIPKKRGGYRTINTPKGAILAVQKSIFKGLTKIRIKGRGDYPPLSTGYEAKLSIRDNATRHVGMNIVFSMDIKDFFPSITSEMVFQWLIEFFKIDEHHARFYTELLTYQGRLPQGAPTSPILSNFICDRMDTKIMSFCKEHHIKYTRYADDLTFSTRYKKLPVQRIREVQEIIESYGFRLNQRKFRYAFSHQQQTVSGLIVNEKLGVSRKKLRIVRAMIHNWDVHGYAAANKLFKLKHPRKELDEHIKGMLAHVKDVLGKEDKRYHSLLMSYQMVEKKDVEELESIRENAYPTFFLIEPAEVGVGIHKADGTFVYKHNGRYQISFIPNLCAGSFIIGEVDMKLKEISKSSAEILALQPKYAWIKSHYQ